MMAAKFRQVVKTGGRRRCAATGGLVQGAAKDSRGATAFSQTIAFFGACLLLAGSLFLQTIPAYAEDDPENVINTQQLPDSSFIYDTSIEDLANADSYFDKQTVQVVGEVVGDVLKAEGVADHRWITLYSNENDANSSISVYLTAEDAEKIDALGKYEQVGTILQVRGVFHLVCPEHDGMTDLHAEYVSVMKPGVDTHVAFDMHKFIPGAVLVLVGLIMLLVFYHLRERRR